MLGRVRPSPCSLDCLELERPASKLIKDDALSIYEATLEKLRLGSRRALSLPSEGAVKIDASASPSNGQCQSVKSCDQEMEDDDSCSSSASVQM